MIVFYTTTADVAAISVLASSGSTGSWLSWRMLDDHPVDKMETP